MKKRKKTNRRKEEVEVGQVKNRQNHSRIDNLNTGWSGELVLLFSYVFTSVCPPRPSPPVRVHSKRARTLGWSV
jgi:hypothetical protein